MRRPPSFSRKLAVFLPSSLGSVHRSYVGVRGSRYVAVFTLLLVSVIANSASAQALYDVPAWSFDAFDRDRDANASERATSKTDGVYGRFDGELTLQPFIGGAYTYAGALTELGLSAYYYQTVGLQVKYADGRLVPFSGSAPFSVSTVSLALRPLFLLRWSKNWEQGPSILDLTIDSVTLKVGGFWAENLNTEVNKRGLETELSFGVPLLAEAHGPWLSFALAHRIPKATHDNHSVDISASARLEWSFSLGQ